MWFQLFEFVRDCFLFGVVFAIGIAAAVAGIAAVVAVGYVAVFVGQFALMLCAEARDGVALRFALRRAQAKKV